MIWKGRKEEEIFLIIFLIFGAIMIFLTPPMCTPDENTHFINAYAVGFGKVLPELCDGELGHYIPEAMSEFISVNNQKYVGNFDIKCNFAEQYFNSWLPNNQKNPVFWNMGKLAMINPAGYLVSGLGIRIGSIFARIVGQGYDTPYNLLIFARIFNVIFYMIVGYFAIKKAPFLKKTMLVLLLMPMSLFLGVSISYDAILIPICALFFSHIFNLILREEIIKKSDIFITLMCTFFMVGIKTAYAPFLLLLLFIPRNKFGDQARYWKCVIATILVGSIVFFGYKVMLQIVLKGFQLTENSLITEQKAYFFSHIDQIPKIAVDTLCQNIMFYMESFYGKLGQLDTNFMLPIAVGFYILLGIILLGEICSITDKISWKIRIADGILAGISFGGIFLMMYLTWTPLVLEVGGSIVSGVQGRYLIPLFLFLCVPFLNGILEKDNDWCKKIKKIGILFSEILVIQSGILTCLLLLIRYWI